MKKIISILFIIFIAFAGCKNESCCCKKKSSSANASCDSTISTIFKRRSIRSYTSQIIDRKTMEEILWCGINAPSGQNKQSWEIRVIENGERFDQLIDIVANAHQTVPKESIVASFRGATTVAFIAHDTSYRMSQVDCGLLGENMMLAATSLGIGSIALGSPISYLLQPTIKEKIREFFSLSEGYELLYCIGFGYANETPEAKPRNKNKILFLE